MNLFVLLKPTPDTVEELVIAEDGRSLDIEATRYKLCDADGHALEQALLLKERHGGMLTVVGWEAPEVQDALYEAMAKGADQAFLLTGEGTTQGSQRAAAGFAAFLQAQPRALTPETLILVRGQGPDDLDGEIGPLVAEHLGVPCLSVVTAVHREENTVRVTKEFAGGWRGEFTVGLPAVLGVQAAEKPPRYVPFAKVRQAMKTAHIERVELPAPEPETQLAVERMYPPEPAGRAQMLEGSPQEVADRLLEILQQHHLV